MFCDPLVAHITEVDLPPAALERAKGRHNRHADPEDEQDDPHWRSTTRITIFPAIDVYTTEQRSGVNVCTLSIQIAASWPNLNKTATAVELRLNTSGSSNPPRSNCPSQRESVGSSVGPVSE